jgi:hypothetical protein
MLRSPHETVATVLVDPEVVPDLEVELMARDLVLWPVATAPTCLDGPRQAFQLRRRMVMARQGEWDDAAEWEVAWISFGDSWREPGEPVPWAARRVLYDLLDRWGPLVRHRRGRSGVAPRSGPPERPGRPQRCARA